jgi:hypothetical protein
MIVARAPLAEINTIESQYLRLSIDCVKDDALDRWKAG